MIAKAIVLDAMGVIYRDADDVGALLIPFVESMGANSDRAVVEPLYLECSRGAFTSADLWRRLGVEGDPDELDSRYLSGHQLTEGLWPFLEQARSSGRPVAALTNDITEWSRLLRAHFQLETHIAPWIVSGEVRERKPHPAMFERLRTTLNHFPTEQVVYVDDRTENLDSAAAIGMTTLHFSHDAGASNHARVGSFAELSALLALG